jgi:hypothetical protein
MKTLFLFTLTAALALNLNARENPFEPTTVFDQDLGKIVELDEKAVIKSMENASYIKEIQEKMSKISSQNEVENENKNKVEEKVTKPIPPVKDNSYSKKEVDSLIQKTKKQTEQKAKELVKKEVQKSAEPTQVVYVKPRSDVAEDEALLTKNILPFLKLEYNDDKLLITTSYTVSKKFSIVRENKIIIDYKAKVNFNTKRDSLESSSFQKVAVGNHKNEGYFRVAIELNDKPSKFKVTYKDDLINISKIN